MLSAHPDKPLSYSSEQILERRRRMLREARHIIAEDGLEEFSIRKLCERSGVATRTFYNAFSSKDRLIAMAIREAYDEFQRFISYKTDAATVDGIVDRTLSTNRRNFKIRNYTKAVVSIYFTTNTPKDIWLAIQDMAVAGWREWLPALRRDGNLKPWVDIDCFADLMANLQYSVINDWCLGRLSDQEYLRKLLRGTLMMMIGAVEGELRLQAEKILADLSATNELPSFPVANWNPPKDKIFGVAPKPKRKKRETAKD